MWLPALSTLVAIAGVIGVTLWQLHLGLLFQNTTTTGGDTGAHFMMPAFMKSNLLPHGHLTGWDPGWYDGYPIYTFYFVLPDALAAVGSYLVPYGIAFKWATVLGSLLLPVAAWACGRLFRLRPPVPAALAAATLPFLFDYTFTIYGGNLFSTLAGEYPFSFSLAMALLFLGLFARGIRTGRHRSMAAVVLAVCILAHIVPAMMALAGAALLTLVELVPLRWRLLDDDAVASVGPGLLRRRPAASLGIGAALWWAVSTVVAGVLLSGWWLVPFAIRQPYSTSMNYQNVTTYFSLLLPSADWWALVVAGLATVTAVALRSRFGLLFAALGGLSALGLRFDPQASLYNVRLLPLWFVCVYLMVGWLFGESVAAVARFSRRRRLALWEEDVATGEEAAVSSVAAGVEAAVSSVAAGEEAAVSSVAAGEEAAVSSVAAGEEAGPVVERRRPRFAPWAPGAVVGPLLAIVAAAAVVVPPFVPAFAAKLPDLGITQGANLVSNWAAWNYTGYEGKPDYAEYRAVMTTMNRVGRRDGCGRAMWEYNADENRFGTPEALMLLPYWTNGCIDSMEGLLFESSTTTPFHFLNQAELSVSPSDPMVGLPYGPLDVPLGVQHLQLLGVRYFMAASPQVQSAAAADPSLRLVATTGPWRTSYNGQPLDTTWDVYEVLDSPMVSPLRYQPVVLRGVSPSQKSWLKPAVAWYDDPARWPVELLQSGPRGAPSVPLSAAASAPRHPVTPTTVSHVVVGTDSISFHVSRLRSPVLVKISYFPNWRAEGADGPWRATPNLMVVVPTSHQVTLVYGTTPANDLGLLSSVLGVVALVLLALVPRRLARRRAGGGGVGGPPGPPSALGRPPDGEVAR
ncbi:MAG: hypothetical protein ACYCVC_05440 [Acidimicrobiales bacterium]